MAALTSLVNFLVLGFIDHLEEFSAFDQLLQIRRRCEEKSFGEKFETTRFIVINVRLLVLGESVDEKSEVSLLKQNDRPIARRLTLVRTSDPLLNYTTAVIGIDVASFHVSNYIAKLEIRDSRFASEPVKPATLENSPVHPDT